MCTCEFDAFFVGPSAVDVPFFLPLGDVAPLRGRPVQTGSNSNQMGFELPPPPTPKKMNLDRVPLLRVSPIPSNNSSFNVGGRNASN